MNASGNHWHPCQSSHTRCCQCRACCMRMQPLLLLLPPASSRIAPAELKLEKSGVQPKQQPMPQLRPAAANAATAALMHHRLKAQQGQCVPQAAPEAATVAPATCGCNRCCSCCCCWHPGPAPTAAAASSLQASVRPQAAVLRWGLAGW